MKAVVVGGGKMGLPLACQLASNGAHVTVCDVNAALVARINAAEAPFYEPKLEELLTANVAAGRLRASTDTPAAVAGAEAVVVIVPALLTAERNADYGNLKAASRAVAKGLCPGTLVSYETTLPVGGCRGELVPVLEESGLKAGRDFFVCFSPERVKSMRVFERMTETPKVVGGLDSESARRGVEFYGRYLGARVIDIGSLEAAEFVKLAGMLYRDLNIALANELAAYCERSGLDAFQIIEAANTDDETNLLTPGIGVGGHCTPVYPYFLITPEKKKGRPQWLLEWGRKINENQPARAVARLEHQVGSLHGKRVHILGLAFRPGVKEHICSPAFALRDELKRRGAAITLEDPLYMDDELAHFGFGPARAGKDDLEIVILNTAHVSFQDADFARWRSKGVHMVLDGRNFWTSKAQQAMARAGIAYLCVGKGEVLAGSLSCVARAG